MSSGGVRRLVYSDEEVVALLACFLFPATCCVEIPLLASLGSREVSSTFYHGSLEPPLPGGARVLVCL